MKENIDRQEITIYTLLCMILFVLFIGVMAIIFGVI